MIKECNDTMPYSNRLSARLSLNMMLMFYVCVMWISGKMALRAEEPGKREQPDVFWIVSDDLRQDAIGVYGNKRIDVALQTPHLDRLARHGVLFENAYVQYPACVPSRASYKTGLYPHATGTMWWDETRPELTYVSEYLADEGYRTVLIGKEHHARRYPPFQQSIHFNLENIGTPSRLNPEHRNREKELGIITDPQGQIVAGTSPVPAEEGDAARVVRASINYLDNYDQTAPLLLYVSIRDPHTPVLPPEPYNRMYDPADMVYPGDEYMDSGRSLFVEQVQSQIHGIAGMTKEEIGKMRSYYYGFASYLDSQLGRFIQYLEDNWQRPYVIIFYSDHGILHGEHGLHAKLNFYDQSIRTPLIIAGSGIPEGTVVEQLVELVDVAPTIMEYTGTPITDDIIMQGRSLLPLIRDPDMPWKQAVFAQIRHPSRRWGLTHAGGVYDDFIKTSIYGELGYEAERLRNIIRDNNLDPTALDDTPYYFWPPEFHFIRYQHYVMNVRPVWVAYQGDELMGVLYDLEKDPFELNNVFDDPEYAPVREIMLEKLKQWHEQTAILPDNYYYRYHPSEHHLSAHERKQLQRIGNNLVNNNIFDDVDRVHHEWSLSGSTIEVSTEESFEGRNSLKMARDDGESMIYAEKHIPVSPGKTYYYSSWHKVPSDVRQVPLRLLVYTGNEQVSWSTDDRIALRNDRRWLLKPYTGGWQQYEWVFTVPDDVVDPHLSIQNGYWGQTPYYIDKSALYEVEG